MATYADTLVTEKSSKKTRLDKFKWTVGNQTLTTDQCPEFEQIAEFTSDFGGGSFGRIYSYPSEFEKVIQKRFSDKDVVVKIMNFADLESDIAKRMSDLGIGPRVYAVYKCKPKYGAIVMERLDITLAHYLGWFDGQVEAKLKSIWTDPSFEATTSNNIRIVKMLRHALDVMQQNDIRHNDLHLENIMLRLNNPTNFASVQKLFLIDFGLSKIQTRLEQPIYEDDDLNEIQKYDVLKYRLVLAYKTWKRQQASIQNKKSLSEMKRQSLGLPNLNVYDEWLIDAYGKWKSFIVVPHEVTENGNDIGVLYETELAFGMLPDVCVLEY